MKYEALAPFYDRLMSHVNYNEWIDLICKVIAKYHTKDNPSIFEIGGGTGNLGKKLIQMGFPYTGSDYSYSMCREARKKKLPFLCADGRKLPVARSFDLVIFLYDGINYLRTLEEYIQLFQEVHQSLTPGGFFLFDITTESNSIRNFSEYIDYEDYEDYSYIRHSYYDEIKTTQYNDFTIFRKSRNNPPSYEKVKEHHIQKVFPAKLIERSIPSSLFKIIGIWDNFSFRKYSSHSERIHFLLQSVDSNDTVHSRN